MRGVDGTRYCHSVYGPVARVDQTADAYSPDERRDIPATAVGAGFPPQGEEGVLDRLVDNVRRRAPPRHPDGQPARVPVIQSGERLFIATRHAAQQRHVIALPGPRPHARRPLRHSHALPVAATDQFGSIIHNQISWDTGLQGHPPGTRAPQLATGAYIACGCPPAGHMVRVTRRQQRSETRIIISEPPFLRLIVRPRHLHSR